MSNNIYSFIQFLYIPAGIIYSILMFDNITFKIFIKTFSIKNYAFLNLILLLMISLSKLVNKDYSWAGFVFIIFLSDSYLTTKFLIKEYKLNKTNQNNND